MSSDGWVGWLSVLTPGLASLSLGSVLVAVTTNQWLFTEEKMINPWYNGTSGQEFLSKHTVSGLWTLCFTDPGEIDMICENIEYFPKEDYSPDPNDSTMAIPYAVTRSAVFFIVATLLLFLGEFSCMYGHFNRTKRIFTFASGVVFIVSGLLMLIGLIMYISVFKAEVGSKLRPRSLLQPPMFTFAYGYSFMLYVSGFMSTELAGTCAVLLYIYRHQRDWTRKSLEMMALNHHPKMGPSSVHLLADHHMYPHGIYGCRRHPVGGYPVGNHVLEGVDPNYHQRRFYLENYHHPDDSSTPHTPKQGVCVSTCMPHDQEQRMSGIGTYYAYPNAYHPSELDAEGINWGVRRDVTSQTMSTTADIVADEDHPDFVTFDLDRVGSVRSMDQVLHHEPSIHGSYHGSTHGLHRSFRSSDTLHKTTPV